VDAPKNDEIPQNDSIAEEIDILRDDICRAEQIPDLYPSLFTPAQWRGLTRARTTNRLGAAFLKVGGRLYVSRSRLQKCMEALLDKESRT
jgi:hypothetical protein